MNQQRIFYLDLIRVVSILLIFIYHFNVALESFNISVPFPLLKNTCNATLGHIGVSLFLLLSGASLAYTYPKYKTLKDFYKKRFLSIFPAFWLIYIGLFLWFDVPEHTGILASNTPLWYLIFSIIGMDGYLYGVLPTFYSIGEWFLGMIIIFYILFPFFYWCMKKFPRTFLIVTIIWYFMSTRLFSFDLFPIERSILIRVFDFILGMYFVTYIKKFSLLTGYLSILGSIIFIFCPIPLPFMDQIELSGIFIFLSLCTLSTLITSKCFSNICMWISQCSYPFFLLHHVILSRVLHKHMDSSFFTAEYFIVIIMTFLYTLFLASGIERMLQTFFHYLKKRKSSSLAKQE